LALNLGITLWRINMGQGAVIMGDRNTLTHWLTYIDPVTRLLDFVVGMLIYRLPRRWGGTGLELASIGLLLGAMVAYPLAGLPDVWRMQLAYLPLMALVIWAFGQGGGGLTRALAGSRRLVLLGDASFALYLVHLPVLHAGLALQEWLDDAALPWLLWSALVSLLAIALSVAVFCWVETPLLARLRPLIAQAKL